MFAAEVAALTERANHAGLYRDHPALLKLEVLRVQRELAKNANARIYLDRRRKDPAE